MKPKNENARQIKRISLGLALLFSLVLMACSESSPGPDPYSNPALTGTIKGTVKDGDARPYPNTEVTFSKGSEKLSMITDSEGRFEGATKGVGAYSVVILPPLSTQLVSANPASINVTANQVATVDFIIDTEAATAHLNFGNVQLLEEIVDENGETPSSANTLLYAANIFDEPIGLLTPIKAPDGHQITLSEFQTAEGSITVSCNGESSTLEIALEGMIPNGTYTFWLAYLTTKRKVGEPIDFMNDFVNFNNPPIGPSSGTGNIAVADAEGKINVSLEHGSCILTDEVALVIPVLYHINGITFGGGHVPDKEEMVHMLVYFQ